MSSKALFVIALVCTSSFVNQAAKAQPAAQAIRETASNLQEKTNEDQPPLTAGPEDKREKTKPGKIDENASKEFKTTASGLKYRILRKTDGQKPKATSGVEVHYKGWLNDLSVFDSSYRRGETIQFGLNQVIKGWTEGVQLMGEGEMIELDIPYELAYGERGTPGGPIPPKAQLHFLIELISIR